MDVAGLWDEMAGQILPELREWRRRLSEVGVRRKPDDTFLTDADLAVQDSIVALIRAGDPGAPIVAEEGRDHFEGVSWAGRVWVVDPIDGTSQFIRPEATEFCSVICLVEDGVPVATLVLAPEIGPDRSAVRIQVDGDGAPATIDGKPAKPVPRGLREGSVTRSASAGVLFADARLAADGWTIKEKATSQTLDLVRTCVDLREVTAPALTPFTLFYRERQKIWDGAAGMCLARAAGLRVTGRDGRDRLPLRLGLDVPEPVLDSVLVAPADTTDWLLGRGPR
jgi:3'(2'), 5'-bisphosphate nucleotidase